MMRHLSCAFWLLNTILLCPVGASQAALIDFEDGFTLPIRTQYCDKGVEFAGSGGRIFEPSVATVSPSHALTNDFGVEFDENLELDISFTTGQSAVSVRVGLDRDHPFFSFGVTAQLFAYSSTTPGTGYVDSAAINLGNVSTPVTRLLEVSSASASIRSVRIAFEGASPGQRAIEVIDDLGFSTIGPTCGGSDSGKPVVQISKPATDGLLTHDKNVELAFQATDDTGVARLQVQFLDDTGADLGSFYTCGAPGAGQCPNPSTSVSYDFFSIMPDDTDRIRVKAWDFAGKSGQAERSVDLLVPGPNLNLWVKGMEITQSTQSWVPTASASRAVTTPGITFSKDAVKLVEGKRTVVRIYPGIEGSGTIPLIGAKAELSCRDWKTFNPCPAPASIKTAKPVRVDPANNNSLNTLRADADKSWNFVLPAAWTEWGKELSLTASVSPPSLVSECVGCSDGANSMTIAGVTFQDTGPLNLQLVWACVRRSSTVGTDTCDTAPLDIHQDVFLDRQNLFIQTYPVAAKDLKLTIHSPQTVAIDGDFNLPNGAMTSGRMQAWNTAVCKMIETATGKNRNDLPVNDLYFGIVPVPTTAISGIGPRNCPVGKLDPGNLPNDALAIAAHEIGHALGRPHASCDHGEADGGGCEPAPAVFPCIHGGICTFGFDTYNTAAIAPGSPPAAGHAHDFMSYGAPPLWVSPYTYGKLLDALATTGTANTLTRVSTALPALPEDSVLWVSGVIPQTTTPEDPARILPVYRLPAETAPAGTGSGGYSLELVDTRGEVLLSRHFNPEFTYGDPPDPDTPPAGRFFEVLPFNDELDAATRGMILRRIRGGDIIAAYERSATPPAITLFSPSGGSVPWDGWIVWEAQDEDADPLSYLVQYSIDDGSTWSTIVSDWTESGYRVDPASLAGSSNARIRVVASDGFDTAIAESASFTVPGKPPMVWISSPAGAQDRLLSIDKNTQLILEGNGTDREDGPLPGASLSWFSSRDGFLGSGYRVDVPSLSAGVHEIELQGRDSNALVAGDGFSIEVLDTPNHQPVASAGDDQALELGNIAVLDGSASEDADGDSLFFTWSIGQRPSGSNAFLDDNNSPTPTLFPDLTGTYRLALVVRDNQIGSLADEVLVEVLPPADSDGDGVPDHEDNCIEAPNGALNPDAGGNIQLDTDDDGYGNACDPDYDNNLTVDFADLAAMKSVFFTASPDIDLNGDGMVDFADLAIMKSLFFRPPGPSGLAP